MTHDSNQRKHNEKFIQVNAKGVPFLHTQEDQNEVSIRNQTIKPTHRKEIMNPYKFHSYDNIILGNFFKSLGLMISCEL